jgi:hypothetical protein
MNPWPEHATLPALDHHHARGMMMRRRASAGAIETLAASLSFPHSVATFSYATQAD